MGRTGWMAAGLVALGLAGAAWAKPEYSLREKATCLTCHTQPKGGKRLLTATGKYYERFDKMPPSGLAVEPRPPAGPAPENAWHPEREPARVGSRYTRQAWEAERATKARMSRWTRGIGAKNCYYCHAEQLPQAGLDEIRESRRRYEVALQHAELTSTINHVMGGGEKVSCYTCHLGGRGPVTMP